MNNTKKIVWNKSEGNEEYKDEIFSELLSEIDKL